MTFAHRMIEAGRRLGYIAPAETKRDDESVTEFTLRRIRNEVIEECAQIAEHLNGWGAPQNPGLANHIAKCIREQRR